MLVGHKYTFPDKSKGSPLEIALISWTIVAYVRLGQINVSFHDLSEWNKILDAMNQYIFET